MRRQITFLLTAVATLVLVAFGLFVVNQVAGAYALASALSPAFGQLVLWTLVLLFAGLFAVPVVLYLRLPKALPAPTNEAETVLYRQRVARRLANNPLLRAPGLDWNQPTTVQQGLATLHARADVLIQNTAKSIFLTTAISQNGKLDGLLVLTTQSKLVWDLAHLYYQRPAPRDLVALYANVGAMTFLATQIEDLDLSEQLEPILSSVVQNSALKSVPFVGRASAVVVDSLLEGSVNAFLTLRVGILARQYCAHLGDFDPRQARRAAYREAGGLLRTLVVQQSGQVVGAIARAARKIGTDTVKSGTDAVGDAGNRVKNVFTNLFNFRKASE